MTHLFHISDLFNGFNFNYLYIINISATLSGILIARTKNPLVSFIYIIFLFFNISCFLIFLGMVFIGSSYLLVHVGAVSILFILMLVNKEVAKSILYSPNLVRGKPPLLVLIDSFCDLHEKKFFALRSVGKTLTHIPLIIKLNIFNFCSKDHSKVFSIIYLIRIFIQIISLIYNKFDIDWINLISRFEDTYADFDIIMYSNPNQKSFDKTEPFFPSSRATPISTPEGFEVAWDREKRTDSDCECCGVSKKKPNSDCPCTGPENSDWKKHSKCLTVYSDHITRVVAGLKAEEVEGRLCCNCTNKGVFHCMHCNCIFCSGHCADNQINTDWHEYYSPKHNKAPSILDIDYVKKAFEKDEQNNLKSLFKSKKEDSDSESSYEGKGKKRKD